MLVGEREDACRIAVESSLWAHAMLIASHMDVNAYRQIVSKFALTQLGDGTPLQSLYLLFADHPAQLFSAYSATGGSNNSSYGIVENWRKNLAMLISNPTSSDRSVKNQLGDLLISKHGQVLYNYYYIYYFCLDRSSPFLLYYFRRACRFYF